MDRTIELLLGEPFYSTYHFQGLSGAVSDNFPSVRNWYLNNSLSLKCNKVFLYGFSSPHLNIEKSSWTEYPYFDKYIYPMRFFGDNIHDLIIELLHNGYFVNFDGIDDYYMEGKTWYAKRHFCHDGLIFGYNQLDNTYSIFAYDSKWQYSKFKVKQQSFDNGKKSMMDAGIYGNLCAVKPKNVIVDINPDIICNLLIEYLNSSLENYPMKGDGEVKGAVVHKYIELYMDKLFEGLIQYDKMDWRMFRVIWEQKKFMLERLQKVEHKLSFDNVLSNKYNVVVKNANTMHMLYSSHHQRRRDSVLPVIKKILVETYKLETSILYDFVRLIEKG